MKERVFVVEDEADIASVLVDYLRAASFEPVHFADGEAALQAALADPPALLLLDLMLPGRDGLDVLRALRERGATPVILLTARVEEVDRLLGLDLGADDYICKPFSPREVIARARAVLRRTGAAGRQEDTGLQLDEDARCALVGGQRVALTPKEFGLLATLAARPGRIYSRAQLLDQVYPDGLDATERTVDSHIKNLRRKLGAAAPGHEWIRSVYGLGFSFEAL